MRRMPGSRLPLPRRHCIPSANAHACHCTLFERPLFGQLCRSKQPVVEPRESAAFNAAAADFRNKLANPAYNGAVFFAVTR